MPLVGASAAEFQHHGAAGAHGNGRMGEKTAEQAVLCYEPSGITTGPRLTGDEPSADRVSNDRKYDRHGAGFQDVERRE